jgi:hypothetical protein
MSSYRVLFRVSHALHDILLNEFRADTEIGITDPKQIVFVNPTVAAHDNRARLSLWLYRVVENGFMKNTPMRRTNDNGRLTVHHVPLTVDLDYLVTPIVRATEQPDRSLLLLGKTMQVLYDRAITVLDEPGFEVAEELRISLMQMKLEELSHIWEALQEPYQLSVCYQVRVVAIESQRKIDQQPVEHRQADFADEPPVALAGGEAR